MAPKGKQPHGPPMTLGNMRELGVQRLIASCLNEAWRHTARIDVSSYPAETEVPSASAAGSVLMSGRTGGSNRHSPA